MNETIETIETTRTFKPVEHVKTAITLDCVGLIDVLNKTKKGQFITIVADTVPTMRKTNNPYFGYIVKRSVTQSTASPDFKTVLANKIKKDDLPEREVKERKWGKRLQNTPFVVHVKKGESEVKLYLEMYVINSLGYVYFDTRTGEIVPKSVVNAFLPTRQKSEVIWRDYGIGGIVELRADGKQYVVKGNFKLTDDLSTIANELLGR